MALGRGDEGWPGKAWRVALRPSLPRALRRTPGWLVAVVAVLGCLAALAVAAEWRGPRVTYHAPAAVASLALRPPPAPERVVSLSASPRLALAGGRLGEAKLALAVPAAPLAVAPPPSPPPVPAARPFRAPPEVVPELPEPAAGPPEPSVHPAAVIRPRLPAGAEPRLAVIIDDLGYDPRAAMRAVALPAGVTLAFLPYGYELDRLTAAAVARGHDVFLHLPMEPIGAEDPGPNAVLTGLEPGELRRRLAWAFASVPRAVGVNNHMGSRATADPGLMLAVLGEVRRRGLFFVDSRTTPVSAAAGVAERLGLPHAARDVFLDNEPTLGAVLARLAEAERLARRRGEALAIGHPFPATLAALEEWLPAAERRGVRLVSARALGGAGAGEGCALLASSAGAPC